jgi:hypothetical protein
MAKFKITWLEDRSDEAVLAEIRRVAALGPGRRLTKDAFDSQSKIKSSAVEKRFGSWSRATRKAGLIDALPEYSNNAILEDLRRVSESCPSEPFTIALYSAQGRYSPSAVKRRFGGWNKALDAAGIGDRFRGPPTTERMRTKPGRAMSNEEILAKIRAVATGLGKASLTGAEIMANSEINVSHLGRFGGVSKALKLAGIEHGTRGRRYTEAEVFENLLKVWTHYGRPPSLSEMDKSPSTFGGKTYIDRYGGWRKALKAFVEQANSEADGNPQPDQDPSSLADWTGPTESPALGSAGPGRPQSCVQDTALPGATGPAPTNIKPADRRAPNIGLRFNVLLRDHFRCQLCGRSPATELGCELHVDHIIPFSKGGKTTFENLRALCAECNVGKSNRSVSETEAIAAGTRSDAP